MLLSAGLFAIASTLVFLSPAAIAAEAKYEMRDPPTAKLRATYPERLWLSDYRTKPQGGHGYAISNDLGTVPAYWTPLGAGVQEALIAGTKRQQVETKDLEDSSSAIPLIPRIPTYVEFYRNRNCNSTNSGSLGRAFPLGNVCVSNPHGFDLAESVFVPSTIPGDVVAFYEAPGCALPLEVMYRFLGCYRPLEADNTVESVYFINCAGNGKSTDKRQDSPPTC